MWRFVSSLSERLTAYSDWRKFVAACDRDDALDGWSGFYAHPVSTRESDLTLNLYTVTGRAPEPVPDAAE